MGVPFEDLIQAGNIGLLDAFNNFDTSKTTLRNNILKDIESQEERVFTNEDCKELIRRNFTYTKSLDQTLESIPLEGFEDKASFYKWAKTNIKGAVFASIAFKWIRSTVITQISLYGKILRLPRSYTKSGAKTAVIRLDTLNNESNNHGVDSEMVDYINNEINDGLCEESNSYEDNEHNDRISSVVHKLLYKLNCSERRIIKKKYGIGYPYPMTIIAISESEHIKQNKVKQYITSALEKMSVVKNNKSVQFDLYG